MSEDPENTEGEKIQKVEAKEPVRGRFYKGQPGGPGRTPGLTLRARYLCEKIDIMGFLARVVEGKEKGFHGRERLQAAGMLMDRGMGKAVDVSIQARIDAVEALNAHLELDNETLTALTRSLALPAGSSPPELPTIDVTPVKVLESQAGLPDAGE